VVALVAAVVGLVAAAVGPAAAVAAARLPLTLRSSVNQVHPVR
jgi:hypothetical protein